ncbi:MAG TPA: 3',5'-cyclic-nucleotide phosphodiesterase [Gammaproteobacteria bacterium]|nr:3',5'-cyclic-nucleotide phosphodiesterase [Gammaproteobacteria bacterium]
MKVRVLGCSGGIYRNAATTSFLIDNDILVDAGTGANGLTLAQMRTVRHIFITHSHLDHIASIPLLADTLFDDLIGAPLVVHALPETISALRAHIFNWQIWPDFSELPAPDNAVLRFEPMPAGGLIELAGRQIESIAVNHTVPAVGYRVQSAGKSFAFSGDTTTNDSFWEALNRHDSLDLLFVESAFADKDRELADKACHYCPQLLAADLAKLKHHPKVCITHLKPGCEQEIMQQCREAMPQRDVQQLKDGDVFAL